MKNALAPLGIQIAGINETGVPVPDIDENGGTPLENARIKALAYYDIIRRPVFACDSGLYIEGLPSGEQPGVHVRMIDGKRLSDDDMIEHYSAIAGRLGGKAAARYMNGICLVMDSRRIYDHFGDDIAGEPFYITSVPHSRRVPGFPLESLSVHISSGRYYFDGACFDGHVGTADEGFRAFFRKALAESA
jgi:8-oxo-dGTP diphosphatase